MFISIASKYKYVLPGYYSPYYDVLDLDVYKRQVLDQVKNHHIVNIALFGSDNARKAQWNDYEMERADATKIISLDFDAKKIKITSLQRLSLIHI